jgi:short-subunit dehydrogenase
MIASSAAGRLRSSLRRCLARQRRLVLGGLLAMIVLAVAGCATTPIAATRGKVVVITGASSGFGKGVALKLAEQGATVVLAARRAALLEDVAQECRRRGGQALAVPTDVADERDVARLAETAASRFGRIDVWINNAGIGAIGRFEDIPLADQKRVIDVNVDGVLYGSYHAMRLFRQQHAGTLINISSVDGKVALAYEAAYVASKHAVRGLGAALYQEVRLSGEKDIHVCTILPYAADTPWWEHAANYSGHSPRLVGLDPAEKVVDVIVRATVNPRREIAAGFKAKAILASWQMAPALTETAAGSLAHHEIYVKAPPIPSTDGSIFTPTPLGSGIEGGVREKIRRENAAQPR